MNTTALIASIALVIIALVLYTISMIIIHRKKSVVKKAFMIQAIGVVMDITGTFFMFNIRPGFSWTLHAVVSLFGLFLMALEVIFLFKYYEQNTPKWLYWYTKGDYVYWLIIFFLGGMLLR